MASATKRRLFCTVYAIAGIAHLGSGEGEGEGEGEG